MVLEASKEVLRFYVFMLAALGMIVNILLDVIAVPVLLISPPSWSPVVLRGVLEETSSTIAGCVA